MISLTFLVKEIVELILAPIKEEQDEYMKSHILSPNNNDWRDDRTWRR